MPIPRHMSHSMEIRLFTAAWQKRLQATSFCLADRGVCDGYPDLFSRSVSARSRVRPAHQLRSGPEGISLPMWVWRGLRLRGRLWRWRLRRQLRLWR